MMAWNDRSLLRRSALTRWTTLFGLLALLCAVGHPTYAATNIYGLRGDAVAGANNILRIDATTGTATAIFMAYPGGNAATLAQCPNGLLYYAINGGVNQLYVFNPQTPNVAPVTLGAGLPDGALKMACSPWNVAFGPSNCFATGTVIPAAS